MATPTPHPEPCPDAHLVECHCWCHFALTPRDEPHDPHTMTIQAQADTEWTALAERRADR